ncbi:MAG TPA: T9SS type A sorting domain-containing protein, partial [Bacteroidales bacterium]|nr:T9SS type A sorting domain-containing protein [Bacteroidales bacterium]
SSWSPAYKFTTKDLSGIDQVASIGNVSIYPNPSTNGHVNVAIPMTSDNTINLSVVNMVGQEIFADVLSLKAGNNLYTLNLRDKENGIYFVKLQSSDNTISRKIILNK